MSPPVRAGATLRIKPPPELREPAEPGASFALAQMRLIGAVAVFGSVAVAWGGALGLEALKLPGWIAPLVGLVLGGTVLLASGSAIQRARRQAEARDGALTQLAQGNAEVRLPRAHPDARLFNTAVTVIHEAQAASRTRRLLLESVIDAAPLAIVVCDYKGDVILANGTARDLFHAGRDMNGEDFEAILAQVPEEMARAVRQQADDLFTVDQGDDEEAYHVSTPFFDLNQVRYRVYLIKQLTRELSRQEVAIWKKVIRVISHELNNSLAPVSSLLHSARVVKDKPEHLHKLDQIFDVIEERTTHLQSFLESYARFARLAPPEKKPVAWGSFLEHIAALTRCPIEGQAPDRPGHFDEAQLQQALINLIKNAREASSLDGAGETEDEVKLVVEQIADGGVRLSVLDRGRGMSDEVLAQAVVPFYSTRKSGGGLGLALCREIVDAHGGTLKLERREGGGIAARIALPGA